MEGGWGGMGGTDGQTGCWPRAAARLLRCARNDGGGVVGMGAKRSRVQERFTPISIFPRQGGRGYAEVCLRGNDGGVGAGTVVWDASSAGVGEGEGCATDSSA